MSFGVDLQFFVNLRQKAPSPIPIIPQGGDLYFAGRLSKLNLVSMIDEDFAV
jgi:hypothetical protein